MKNIRMMAIVTVDSELEMERISLEMEQKAESDKVKALEFNEVCRLALDEWEWDNSKERRSLMEWLRNPANFDDVNYSDIYKDVYGFRP